MSVLDQILLNPSKNDMSITLHSFSLTSNTIVTTNIPSSNLWNALIPYGFIVSRNENHS